MKKLLSVIFSVLFIALSAVCVCAAGDGLTVNSAVELNLGDTLSYTLYLSDCEQPLVDMAAYIYYDSEYLELDPDSLEFPSVMGVNRNTAIDGYIPFNFSALSSPVDFSEKKPVITLDFKAKKNGSTDVRYFIGDMEYMKGDSNITIKEFCFTCDYAVNGELKAEAMVPALLTDQAELNLRQGNFINYEDGKGENGGGAEHIAVTGEMSTPTSSAASSNNFIIYILAGVLVALAIAVLVILRKRFSSDNDVAKTDETEPKE